MDAVTQNGLGAEDAVVLQTLDRAAAIVLQAVVPVSYTHLSENGQGLAAGVERAMDAEHGTLSVMFCDDPGHQLPEGNGGH